MFTLYAGMYLLPVFLQSLCGQTAYESGMIQLPSALVSTVASFAGGVLVDRLGTKAVAIPGLIIMAIAEWGFAKLTLNTPFATLQIWLILRGVALGMTVQPIQQAALAGLKMKQVSQGSTINSVIRDVASSMAVALATTMTTTQTAVHYVRLAEQVTVGSSAASLLQQIAGYFQTKGFTQAHAMTAAIQVMYDQLQQQATVLAMSDVYLITVAAGIIAVFIMLFLVREGKANGKHASSSEGAAEEEEESGEPVFMH
jgi:MFS family permease